MDGLNQCAGVAKIAKHVANATTGAILCVQLPLPWPAIEKNVKITFLDT